MISAGETIVMEEDTESIMPKALPELPTIPKMRRGRPRKKPGEAKSSYVRISKKDEHTILRGLKEFKPLYIIANEIGCCRQTLYAYLRDVMDIRYREMRESMLDVAENRLFKNVLDGNQNAIEYFLDRQGRGRGYGVQQQMDRQDVPTINIGRIEITDAVKVEMKKQPDAIEVEAEVVDEKGEEDGNNG